MRSGHSPGGVVAKLSLSNHMRVVLFVFVVNHAGGNAQISCSVVFGMWMFYTDLPIFEVMDRHRIVLAGFSSFSFDNGFHFQPKKIEDCKGFKMPY